MEERVITIPANDPLERATWEAVVELHRRHPTGWTLIGAQMVALHGYEHDQPPPRRSLDADVLANARLVEGTPLLVSRTLEAMGFKLAGMNSFDVGHRFLKDDVEIDVLAPDGLSTRTRDKQLLTVPPAHTVSVPGGSQALDRTETVAVRIGTVRGTVPRPSLLGAILIKVQAITVDDAPDNQRRDVAFLCSLVDDPRALAGQLEGNQRKWLRDHAEMTNPDADAWRLMGTRGEDALRAYRILAGQ